MIATGFNYAILALSKLKVYKNPVLIHVSHDPIWTRT